MESIYKCVIENAAKGKMEKQAAIDLLKLLGEHEDARRKDIGVIGMAFRLPEADSVEEFRENIRNGREVIRDFPRKRKEDGDAIIRNFQPDNVHPEYLKLAYLKAIDEFDYNFFQISPKEAALMDPNQRIFLETAWKALEDAGYANEKMKGTKTGIYLGYRSDHFYEYRDYIAQAEPENIMRAYLPNMPAVIAGRISYLFNFRGPGVLIDTSCSSSLAAVHYACRGLRNQECDMAIAGGIKVNLLPLEIREKLGVESSNGEVRTFDQDSDGAVMGEGSVALLLKPLEEAVRDNDNIYAVIKGSAVNHDGRSIGIAAPNAVAHEQVIADAWEDAGIHPDTISYIEAHGTGTTLGDPVEIDGIKRAFERYTQKKQFCAVASVKPWIGHLDNAAGIAGMVNAIIALKNRELPYVRYFDRPNLNINFKDSPVYVSARPAAWTSDGSPRRCGVSSFGMSGTNCHVVLEEFADDFRENSRAESAREGLSVFVLSAKTQDALQDLVKEYEAFLRKDKAADIRDICYTACTGRFHYLCRLAVLISDREELVYKLGHLNKGWSGGSKEENIYYTAQEIIREREGSQVKKGDVEAEAGVLGREAEEVMERYIAGKKTDNRLLRELCCLYVAGGEFSWKNLYDGPGKYYRVSLPTYPFRRTRCWLEIPDHRKDKEKESLFYQKVWRNCDLAAGVRNLPVTAMVIHDHNPMGRNIAERLPMEGWKVIEVEIKNGFRKVSELRYEIGSSQSDYEMLIQDLGSVRIEKMIHMVSAESNGSQRELPGFFSLFYLIKALAGNPAGAVTELLLIADNAEEVTGEEEIIVPENAALFGLGMDIRWEYPHILCRCIDIDKSVTAEQLIQEFHAGDMQYKIAYREGGRFASYLEYRELSDLPEERVEIRAGGTYLITGGMGAMGLEIMAGLTSRNKVNIILTGRSILPPREQWDSILQTGEDAKWVYIIEAIRKAEERGSRIAAVSADVSHEGQMRKALDKAKDIFGEVNGIFHAAGVKRGRLIADNNERTMLDALKPKVRGTVVLDKLFSQEPMDFMVLCSSVAALIGEYGNAGYAGGNAFLDSYAAYRTKSGRKTLSVNWSTWDLSHPLYTEIMEEKKLLFRKITAADALAALAEAMSRQTSNIIIGRLNIRSDIFKIKNQIKLNFSPAIQDIIEREQGKPDRHTGMSGRHVRLKGRPDGNYSEVERQIGEAWSEVLGYENLDINSNFFEIGGDSISIARLHELIMNRYSYTVSIMDLFAYPSIYKLSCHLTVDPVEVEKWEEDLESNVEALLDSLNEEVSIDSLVERFHKIGKV